MTRPSLRMFPHVVAIQLRDTEATDSTASLNGTATTVPGWEAVRCLVADKGGEKVRGFDREFSRKKVRVSFPRTGAFPPGSRLGAEHQIIYVGRDGASRTLLVDSFRDDLETSRVRVAECFEAPNPTA